MITDKDSISINENVNEIGKLFDCDMHGFRSEVYCVISRIRAESAEQARKEARKDYQDVIDDYRRLTKDLDIALNGDCAAKQASLCDIVAQVRSLGTITEIIMRSAEQARKEAADMVEKAWREHGEDITLRMLRESILGDYATDQTEGEKLAIAVKALEEIKQIRKAGPAFESHFSKLQDIGRIINDALKEIQG